MSSITKSDIDKVFGKVLKDFRIKNHMTQEQLSEKLGISLKYISRIENGNSGIKTMTLINYMNILGITPNTIYSQFINNKSIKQKVELSKKIEALSEEKQIFIDSIVDLLKDLN